MAFIIKTTVLICLAVLQCLVFHYFSADTFLGILMNIVEIGE